MRQRQSSLELSATIGLCWLIEHFRLPVAIPATRSEISPQTTDPNLTRHDALRQQPRHYLPNGWLSHLRYALLYEPIPLDVYRVLFRVLDTRELAKWIRSRPESTAARRAWYLYELLLEERLDLPDVSSSAYVDLLSPTLHVTGPRKKVQRQRIYDNLIGCARFSPLVRRTDRLHDLLDLNLGERADVIAKSCSPSILAEAVQSLFLRFSGLAMSSGEIMGADDTERFVSMVMRSEAMELTTRDALVQLHDAIVGSNMPESDWRHNDHFAVNSDLGDEHTRLILADCEDLDPLMNDWMEFVRSVEDLDQCQPVVIAAVAACAFLLIRPFAAGSRRMHVVIIHHLLSTLRFVWPGTLCSVSAATLKSEREYCEALQLVSMPMSALQGKRLEGEHAPQSKCNTALWIRYFDATPFVEYLMDSIDGLISIDLPEAIQFFKTFGPAFRSLPGSIAPQRAEMLVHELLQHKGSLSQAERAQYVDFPDDCLLEMEKLVCDVLRSGFGEATQPQFTGSKRS